jgi:hypothetical protein
VELRNSAQNHCSLDCGLIISARAKSPQPLTLPWIL